MTRQEFIDGYCSRSWVAWDRLSEDRVCVPCACGESECEGWAMAPRFIADDPFSLAVYTHGAAGSYEERDVDAQR